jgi:uncharacterized protein with FMN-binding domain
MNPGSRNTTAITIGIVILILAIAGGVSLLSKKDDTTTAIDPTPTPVVAEATATPSVTDPTPSSDDTSTPTPTASSTYKNGTYTATGSYSSPGGTQQIEVTLTLANDVVTAASAVGKATDGDAREFQSEFVANFKGQVVGKSIASLNLGKVSGSSLTPKGFNSAVSAIKSQAS